MANFMEYNKNAEVSSLWERRICSFLEVMSDKIYKEMVSSGESHSRLEHICYVLRHFGECVQEYMSRDPNVMATYMTHFLMKDTGCRVDLRCRPPPLYIAPFASAVQWFASAAPAVQGSLGEIKVRNELLVGGSIVFRCPWGSLQFMNCQHGTFVGEMCSLIPLEDAEPVPVGAQVLSSFGPQDSRFKKLCCAQCYVASSSVKRRAFCTVQLLTHMQVQPCKRKRSEERSAESSAERGEEDCKVARKDHGQDAL